MLKLETERLVIRDHEKTDLESYHKLISDIEVMKYLPDIKTSSIEESRKSLNNAVFESQKGESRIKYYWGIFNKKNNYIGEIGYTVTSSNNYKDKIVHLGYFIQKRYWNHGYTSEALSEVLKFAFTQNNVLKIETGCITENIYSEKIMKKFKFSKESHKRNHQWVQDQLLDRVEYGLHKREYETR